MLLSMAWSYVAFGVMCSDIMSSSSLVTLVGTWGMRVTGLLGSEGVLWSVSPTTLTTGRPGSSTWEPGFRLIPMMFPSYPW